MSGTAAGSGYRGSGAYESAASGVRDRDGAGGGKPLPGAGGLRERRKGVGAGRGSGKSRSATLRYRGCANFRLRVVCATLAGRALRIDGIREHDESPGLQAPEASFLRLVDKLTNGCKIEINETGTSMRYIPGFIVGGPITHDCGTARGIGYFLEGVLPLIVFGKKPASITFEGITNNNEDLCVDTIRTVTMPLLQRFLGVEGGLTLKVKKRGAPPRGGGKVEFSCPVVRQLVPLQVIDQGFVKRIRGVAYTTKVSPQTGNRMVESGRALLNKFIPDVYIHTDHYKGSEGGGSPGFGLSLVAESTSGCLVSAESAATDGVLPEDLGVTVSRLLCEEIARGGCIDSNAQSLAFLMMVLSPEDVSKIRVGSLTDPGMECLRHIRDVFGVTFKIKPDPETKTVLVSCLGVGYTNYAKKVT